jgi:tetratricopeptide (TPR) repeat protein
MELILKNNPTRDNWLDTYANLLYKVGRKEEAIKHEEIALSMAKKNNRNNVQIFEEVLRKMHENRPTWE